MSSAKARQKAAMEKLNLVERALENHAQLQAKDGRLIVIPEKNATISGLMARGLTENEALAETKYHFDALNALVGDTMYAVTNEPFRGMPHRFRQIEGLEDAMFMHNVDNSAFVLRQGKRGASSTKRTHKERSKVEAAVLGDMFHNNNPVTGVSLGVPRVIETPTGPMRVRSALDLEHLIDEAILKRGDYMDPRISNREYNLYLGNASANKAKSRFASQLILNPTPEDVADILFQRYAQMDKRGITPSIEHEKALLEQRNLLSERKDIRLFNRLLDEQSGL